MKAHDLPDFTDMTRREIEDYLIERAMTEPRFREELLRDADSLLRELGLPVGDDVKIRVLEEEPKSFYLVLPRVLQNLEEATEADLDNAAGGIGPNTGMFRFFRGYT